jgi:hypothetical protein
MSWDADLLCDTCSRNATDQQYGWNYTHNTNCMANAAVPGEATWWKRLHGMTGAAGAAFLDQIVKAMEADPARFRAMDPPNQWGNYGEFLSLLREMRDAVPEHPTHWSVHG